jgi:hypothetical protein
MMASSPPDHVAQTARFKFELSLSEVVRDRPRDARRLAVAALRTRVDRSELQLPMQL